MPPREWAREWPTPSPALEKDMPAEVEAMDRFSQGLDGAVLNGRRQVLDDQPHGLEGLNVR